MDIVQRQWNVYTHGVLFRIWYFASVKYGA